MHVGGDRHAEAGIRPGRGTEVRRAAGQVQATSIVRATCLGLPEEQRARTDTPASISRHFIGLRDRDRDCEERELLG
jgi:hypothetical protein